MNNFEQEVRQNRPRMALAELVPILQDLNDRLIAAEAKIAELESAPASQPEPKKAPAKKSTATKKAAVKKEDADKTE